MDRDGLLERLRGIEWDDFEVKAATRGIPDDGYKTVSAFANSRGGWLLFGVAEGKRGFEVVGVPDPDGMQNDFLGSCRSRDKFSRVLDVRAKQYVIDGAVVLGFYVPAASRFEKPVKVKVEKHWQTYIRVGSGDHRCSSEEEARFLRDASHETFDSIVRDGTSLSDLDPQAVKWYRGLIAQRDPDRAHPDLDVAGYLEEIGLIRGKGAVTYGAALMFGKERLLAGIKPGGVVDLRIVNGPWAEETPEQRWDDRQLCEGNLVSTLRSLFEKLVRLIPQPFQLDDHSAQRQGEAPDYRAVREALVNLLIHQDYSDQHRTATIRWYTDRVVFENPGDSFVELPEMLDGGSSQLRNPNLVRLLRQVGFAEQAGTGIPSIVRAWRRALRQPPIIENDPGRKLYRLTLGWLPLATKRDEAWYRQLGVEVSEDAARLLTVAREAGPIEQTRARLVTGLSGREVTRLLSSLVVQGLLVPEEGGEAPSYGLATHLRDLWPATKGRHAGVEGVIEGASEGVNEGANEGARGKEERLSRLLRLISASPGLRVPQLVSKTGWSRASVERLLKELKETRLVEYRGATKTGGYHPLGAPEPRDRK